MFLVIQLSRHAIFAAWWALCWHWIALGDSIISSWGKNKMIDCSECGSEFNLLIVLTVHLSFINTLVYFLCLSCNIFFLHIFLIFLHNLKNTHIWTQRKPSLFSPLILVHFLFLFQDTLLRLPLHIIIFYAYHLPIVIVAECLGDENPQRWLHGMSWSSTEMDVIEFLNYESDTALILVMMMVMQMIMIVIILMILSMIIPTTTVIMIITRRA